MCVAVCGFEAFINGKHIVGEVKEKEQAHKGSLVRDMEPTSWMKRLRYMLHVYINMMYLSSYRMCSKSVLVIYHLGLVS